MAGRAQQAYAAMSATDALVYAEVKKAILQRYDINEETYRQRFRAARRKEGEPYIELATRMTNLFRKWTADCSTTEAMAEKLLIKQLLDTMPVELRIWLSEKKPTTGREAGKLADDYLLARRRSRRESGGRIHESHHQGSTPNQPRKCYSCGQQGHLARNCLARTSEGRPENTPPASTNTLKENTPREEMLQLPQAGPLRKPLPQQRTVLWNSWGERAGGGSWHLGGRGERGWEWG